MSIISTPFLQNNKENFLKILHDFFNIKQKHNRCQSFLHKPFDKWLSQIVTPPKPHRSQQNLKWYKNKVLHFNEWLNVVLTKIENFQTWHAVEHDKLLKINIKSLENQNKDHWKTWLCSKGGFHNYRKCCIEKKI